MATTETRNIVVRYKADATGLRSTLRSMDTSLAQTARSMQAVDSRLATFGRGLRSLAGLAGITFSVRGLESLLQSAATVQRLDATLKGVAGSQADFARSLDFVRAKAEQYGLAQRTLTEGYAKFLAAGKGAGQTLNQIEDQFDALATASAAFNLSASDLEGVILGWQQSLGNATVNMEDLRQVVDRLPGGMNLATKAAQQLTGNVNLTSGEFKKLVAQGQILTGQFLPLLAQQLRTAFSSTAAANAHTFTAEMNRLNTAIEELYRTIAESGILDVLARFVNALKENFQIIRAIGAGGDLTALFAGFDGLNESIIPGVTALNAELINTKRRIEDLSINPISRFVFRDEIDRLQGRLKEIQAEIKRTTTAFVAQRKELAAAAPARTTTGPNVADVAAQLKGLNLEFAANLQALINDASAKGITIGITSGLRSTEKQAQLWADALVKYGSAEMARKWVAPPGSSFHEKGVAADLKATAEGYKYLAENVARFGLALPLANERWHVELAGVRDKGRDAANKIKQANAAATKSYEGLFTALSDYRSLVESTLTPQERFNQQIAELNNLRDYFEQHGFTFSADVYVRGVEQAREQFDAAKKGMEGINQEADATKATMAELGAVFSSAFEDAIVNGGNLSDIFKGLEKDIIRIITRMYVLQPLMKTLFGDSSGVGGLLSGIFGGGKALGGPVTAGTGYLVGERGPELFVPSSNGRIVPNNALTVNVVVNNAGRGSESRNSASQLAATLGREVQRAMARNL